MSTQVTDPRAVQFLFNTLQAICLNQHKSATGGDLVRAIDRLSYNWQCQQRTITFKCEQLHYLIRVLQVLNCRSFNKRYKDSPEMLSCLHSSEKVKKRFIKVDECSEPTRKEIMQAYRLIEHLDYNLDDYSYDNEQVIDIISTLKEKIIRHLLEADSDYQAANWGTA